MKNLFNLKYFSFTTKITLSLLIIIIIFSILRAILTMPKVQDISEKKVISYISKTLEIIKNQFILSGKAIKMQANLESSLLKEKIENKLKKMDLLKLNKIELIKQINKINTCSYKLSYKDFIYKKLQKKDYFSLNKRQILEEWIEISLPNQKKSFRNKKIFFYNYKFKNIKYFIEVSCTKRELNPTHMYFENELKKNINTKLLANLDFSTSKVALFWINPALLNNQDKILFSENKQGYFLSKLSNVQNIPTGNLTLRQLLSEKNLIEHKIGKKEVYTWSINLYEHKKVPFLLVYTINKEEIENQNKQGIFFFLTEKIIAIGISFLFILFLLRNTFIKIDKISKTAIKVNEGYKNIRCNVTGEDDIGILGQAFDTMLDFFENSIKMLDKKVEEKTKEILKSLEEKDLLLKEIHHRVKNNLALTISLIELQEEEVKDKKTKKALIDIQERIFSMELLHRKLYESENINYIFFKDYVIDLVKIISHSYDISNKVLVEFKIEKINLNIEKAMPCGIILNELVTNAYKYAFNKQNKPVLKILIYKNKNILTIIVQDNGNGLKENFEKINEKTLGLKLINKIVKLQLLGTIEYFYNKGAKFIIKVKDI